MTDDESLIEFKKQFDEWIDCESDDLFKYKYVDRINGIMEELFYCMKYINLRNMEYIGSLKSLAKSETDDEQEYRDKHNNRIDKIIEEYYKKYESFFKECYEKWKDLQMN